MFVIAIAMVVALAALVHYHTILQLDIYLSRDLQAEANESGGRSFIFQFLVMVSFFGRSLVAAVMVATVAGIFWLCKYYRETIFTLLTSLAILLNFIIKALVDRPRPSDSLVKVIDHELDPSFPSGHVVFYTVFFGFLIAVMLRNPKIPKLVKIPVIISSSILIIVISFSRIYLGAHWASDVLAGYLLGIICLTVLIKYYLGKM